MNDVMEVVDTSKLFFSADFHHGHGNIIKYCNRPFENLHEMNKALTTNWNEVIPEDAIVYFLGDFCWAKDKVEELKARLKGTIIFIRGNHDRGSLTGVKELQLKTPDGLFRLSHDPNKLQWNQTITADLVAHVHEKWQYRNGNAEGKRFWHMVNVGVDVWGFKPVAYAQIITLLKEKNE